MPQIYFSLPPWNMYNIYNLYIFDNMILNAINQRLFRCKKNIPLPKNVGNANATSIGKIAKYLVTKYKISYQWLD